MENVKATPSTEAVTNGSADPLADSEDLLNASTYVAPYTIRHFFATKVPWRARMISLALVVGLLCGIVAVLYEVVMDYVIEMIWLEGGPLFASYVPWLPAWTVRAPPVASVARVARPLGTPPPVLTPLTRFPAFRACPLAVHPPRLRPARRARRRAH